jgi:hypothetical protein
MPKQLQNIGKPMQDPTNDNTFNKMQNLSGASTLPMADSFNTDQLQNSNMLSPMDTQAAQQTQLGSVTEVNPATGQAETIQTTRNY